MLSSWYHRVSVQILLGLAVLAGSAMPVRAQGPASNWQPPVPPYYQLLLQQELLLLQMEQQQLLQQQMMLNWYQQQMAQGTAQRLSPPGAAANAPRNVPTAAPSRTTPPTPAALHAKKTQKK